MSHSQDSFARVAHKRRLAGRVTVSIAGVPIDSEGEADTNGSLPRNRRERRAMEALRRAARASGTHARTRDL